MKKYLYAIAALLALAACSKVTMGDGTDAQREVNFQVANYVQTKADGGKFDPNTVFGTYAWFDNGTAVTEWMVNEPVGLVGKVWKTTEHTYFWPKTGKADFISYAPFAGEVNTRPVYPTENQSGTAAPAAGQGTENEETPIPEPLITRVVSEEDGSVSYTFEYGNYNAPYRANGSQYDLMYADWYQGNANVDRIKDDDERDSGYEGVPTLFHHALCRIGFQIHTNFTEYGEGDAKTTWEVTLQKAVLHNMRHTGYLKLTMDENKKWVKPTFDVWTPYGFPEDIVLYELPKDAANENRAPGQPLTKEDWYELMPESFMLPQYLNRRSYTPDFQYLELWVHIKTTLSNGNVITERYETNLELSDMTRQAGLPEMWKMNQRLIYKISIKPTALGPGGGPQDDPTDVPITFDPAVDGWEGAEVAYEYVL